MNLGLHCLSGGDLYIGFSDRFAFQEEICTLVPRTALPFRRRFVHRVLGPRCHSGGKLYIGISDRVVFQETICK